METRRATGHGPGRRALGATLALTGLVCVAGSGVSLRPAVAAHGGTVELNRVAAGPYMVSVWTQPSPPRPGPWHVDVAVMRGDGLPLVDVRVRVRAEPLEATAEPVETEARRDADPLGVRHRASLPLGTAGPWRVTVSVAGSAGSGALAFPVDVAPSRWRWWPVGLAGAAALGGLGVILKARRRRLAGVAAALVLTATPAWPHASLVRSSPARRATLATAPDRVQLWFSEAVEPRFSAVSVWDAAGGRVDLQDARVEPEDPTRLTVGVKPLGRGAYRVRFRVLSVDGHVVESEFPFTVR